eukprot:gene26152-biopygen14442
MEKGATSCAEPDEACEEKERTLGASRRGNNGSMAIL